MKENPQKALDALILEGTKDEYPEEFWSKLIKYLPEDASPQLRRDFLYCINRLPKHVIIELGNALGQFLKDKLKSTIEFDYVLGWSVYDYIVEGILSSGENAFKSSIYDVDPGGKIVESSRRTLDHAISSP